MKIMVILNYNKESVSDPYWNYCLLTNTDTMILYYTGINGNITNVMISKLGNINLINDGIYTLQDDTGKNARIKYIGKGKFLIIDPGYNYGMSEICFENKFVVSPLNQDHNTFSEKYSLKYTSIDDIYNNDLGSYFMINSYNEMIIDKFIIATGDSTQHNLLDNFQNREGIFFTIYDETKNSVTYVLNKIFLNDKYINVLIKPDYLSSKTFNFVESYGYLIFIYINRPYIEFNSYTTLNNHNLIVETSPISIMNRILLSYMSHNNNINFLGKELELFNKYNQINYSNRIIKIKVCPIDDKGFSLENNTFNFDTPDNITKPIRQIPNYKKKLFPYHEHKNVLNFTDTLDGEVLEIANKEIRRYQRINQSLDNNHNTFKQFLPGMGVYSIKEDIYQNKIVGNLDNIDSFTKPDSVTFNPNYIYGKYSYTSKFIGYTLGTSIDNIDEMNASYRINSENFSKGTNEISIYSEYYLYVLLDPSLTTQYEIDDIFDELNQDDVHYVFDGSADVRYSESEPLIEPGITRKGTVYEVEHDGVTNSENYNLKPFTRSSGEDTTAVNGKNIFGQLGIIDSEGVTRIFDDETRGTFLQQQYYEGGNNFYNIYEDSDQEVNSITGYNYKNSYKYIDLLQTAVLGCIVIEKDILNKTLEGYNYVNRIACATQVEKPVFLYENKKSGRYDKCFLNGSLEILYQEKLKNKCVLNYNPIFDEHHFRSLNKDNIIIEDIINLNNKINNNVEVNDHSINIDLNKDNQVYNNLNSMDKELVDGVNPLYTFESGSDLVFIDSFYKSFKYNSGPEYETFLGPNNQEVLFENSGIENRKIDILLGNIIPNMYIDNELSYFNDFNKLTENTCLLDLEYNDQIKLSNKNIAYGKYKSNTKYIAGNNSLLYNKSSISEDSEEYEMIYNEIPEVLEIGNLIDPETNQEHGYFISTYDISILRKNENDEFILNNEVIEYRNKKNLEIPILHDMLVVLSGYIKDKNGNEPFNKPNNTELSIIKNTQIIPKETSFNLLIKFTDSQQIVNRSVSKIFSEKCILYITHNKIQNNHSNSESGNKYYITYPVLYTGSDFIKEGSDYTVQLSESNNKLHYEYIESNDIVLFDFGNKRQINIGEKIETPYNQDEEGTLRPSTTQNKIINFYKDSNLSKLFFNNLPLWYPINTSIILLKNILIDHTIYDNSYDDPIAYNNISTQPFISNNEWYTKIFYNNPIINIGKHTNNLGENKTLFNIEKFNYFNMYTNKLYTSEVFIHGMKGLSLPFQNLNLNSENIYPNLYDELLFLEPCDNDTYNSFSSIKNDYQQNYLENEYIPLNGTFKYNRFNYDHENSNIWEYADIDAKMNYLIVKGLYFGFGGIIQERYNSNSIMNVVSNEYTNRIARIKEVNNKFYMFLELDTNKSPLIVEKSIQNFRSNTNQSARSNQLEYDTLLSLIENNL